MFLPMYWFTKAVAGDLAKVEVMIPPGTEVHEYQATPANVQAIEQADVLVKKLQQVAVVEISEDQFNNERSRVLC